MSKPIPLARAYAQRGYTLIELMIATVMGLALIGSVVFSVTGAGQSGRKQDAMGQMTEDGQIALNLIAAELRMAGFWTPQPLGALDPQTMIRGCRNGFADPNATFPSLACNSGIGNDSIAVRYDAREPGGIPRDCIGKIAGDLANAAIDNGTVDSRFYIATSSSGNPALFCRGNGSALGGQALIENVESLQLRYGLGAVAAAPAGPIIIDPKVYTGAIARYVRADALTYAPTCSSAAPVASSWCAVTSIRVCIVMRSNDNTGEKGTDGVIPSYVDCTGTRVTPTDRRLRRAMETTISVRNRTTVAGG